jgi:hypothetical protein
VRSPRVLEPRLINLFAIALAAQNFIKAAGMREEREPVVAEHKIWVVWQQDGAVFNGTVWEAKRAGILVTWQAVVVIEPVAERR